MALSGRHRPRDVPGRQLDRLEQGLIGEPHPVVRLVAVLQAAQNLECLVLGGRLDDNRLEPSLQSAVFLDVLAVFIEGRGADALHLAAGQGRLQDVRGVDRAFRAAGADQRMQLIDEQNDVRRPSDLVDDRLDALLELAAVLRPGDHHRQVEHDDALVLENLGHLLIDDLLAEAFDDGGLADAGLAQKHRVILRASAKYLDQPLDLAASGR